jgi:hypothetical protein
VGVALLLAPKIGPLCPSPNKVGHMFLLVTNLRVKTQKTYRRKLMKVRLKC